MSRPPAPLPASAPAAPASAAPLPPLVPARWPLVGHAAAMSRGPLAFFRTLAREGDVVRVRAAGRTFVLVAHPDDAREVLVTQQKRFVRGYAHRGLKLMLGEGLLTSEGDFHRRQRRLVNPAFHRERIARYARAMVAAADRWDERWRALGTPGGAPAEVDLAAEMMALTLGIAGETLFGARVEGAAAEVAEALADSLRVAPLAFLPLGGLLLRLPVPPARRFREAGARLDRIVYGMIAERRRARAEGGAGHASGADEDDLLGMLLDATDPEEADGAPMPDAQLRDEAMTLFLAGHETTASALAWTWIELSRHPHVAARLHAELDAVLGAGDGARLPTFEDLPRLPYARQVLAESMRLHPPAYAIGRICAEPTVVGGHRLERGWGVVTSPWLCHHDPRWWPEPEAFRPERWGPEGEAEAARRPRMAYFPFGAGSRICVGEQFAWTEAILVLATLARRWVPTLASDAPVREFGAITLRPAGPVRAALRPR